MADLRKLPVRDKKGDVYVVVETPRGSAGEQLIEKAAKRFRRANGKGGAS